MIMHVKINAIMIQNNFLIIIDLMNNNNSYSNNMKNKYL